jgi:hypothetical protein
MTGSAPSAGDDTMTRFFDLIDPERN